MTKAEKTRKYIIEKTADIFNTKGYAGTSLNDITEATGLTKGSIYGNFTNKDEVALAAFDYNFDKVTSKLNIEISKKESTKDKLLVYSNIYPYYLSGSYPAGGCPVLNTAVDADDTHPELRKKALAAVLSWKNAIVKLVENGIKNKELSKGNNPEQVALTIIALLEGGIMIARLTGKLENWNLITESLKKYINSLT